MVRFNIFTHILNNFNVLNDLNLLLGTTIMKYKIPSHLLAYFEAESLKSIDTDGHPIQTLAIGVGHVTVDCIYINELVFPSQEATDSYVEDKGTKLSSLLYISVFFSKQRLYHP